MDATSLLLVFVALLVGTSAGFLVAFLRYRSVQRRYAGIVNIDAAVLKARGELDRLTSEAAQVTETRTKEHETLDGEYRKAKTVYDTLKSEISLLEENLEDISFGLYTPHYDFATSVHYKDALQEVRSEQRVLIRAGRGVRCEQGWTVNGSTAEGQRMQKQYSKLLLRAFNGECDAAVANVTWNNVVRMEERVRKSFEAINKLGGVMQMQIEQEYRDLRLKELHLKHELEETRQEEKEEERRRREQMRDEEKAQREMERAREEAEEEEVRYERALAKARADVSQAQGDALIQLTERIKELQENVRVAHEHKERAVARAQLTRSGHVYIISNIGSFGERVVKIGLTRRLEPRERIKELSDASVPFDFDVHAILYSEDAPALEASFHQAFARQRINLVNGRKEFFAVTVEEIEEFVRSQNLNCVLNKLCEARDYRETLARRNGEKKEAATTTPSPTQFPDALLRAALSASQER